MGPEQKSLPKKLEAFASRYVPLLRAYLKREGLRDADKIIRDELVNKLNHLKQDLENVIHARVDKGEISSLDILDRSTRKLEKIRDTIRFASRGYAGIFDPQEVMEEQLIKLVEFDESIFSLVEGLEKEIKDIADANPLELKSKVLSFEQAIQEFDRKLGERDKLSRSAKEIEKGG